MLAGTALRYTKETDWRPFYDRLPWGMPLQQSKDIHYPSLSQGVIKRARKRLRPENPPDRLLGRQQLLEEGHRRLLVGEFPILVHGIPGIGKSAFLAALVSKPEIREAYEDNIFWINLRESSSSMIEIADEISKGLGYHDVLNERNTGPKLRALQATLSSDVPKHIVVFDNADLSEHEEALIQFQRRVTSSMVIGSRTRLEIHDTEPLVLRELDPQSAIQMFKIHAKVEANDTQIAPICELVGFHPQAIRLAGPGIWLNELTLEELAEILKFKKLEVLSRGVKSSERDMRTSFAQSYDDIASPDERYVFDVLGAFALLGAPLSTIAATANLLPDALCRRLLARLRSRSLVEQDERDQDNYRTHPLLHEFAREKLSERERLMIRDGARFEDTPTGRLVDYYVRYAKRYTENFPALEVAHDNLLQVAHWSWRNRAWEAVHNLWEALNAWLDGTGEWGNLYTLQEWAVQANRILPNRQIELAKILVARSTYFDNVGKIGAAIDDAEESLMLGRSVEDRKTIVSGLTRLGFIYQVHLNELEQGHNNFEEAWKLCQDIPDWDEVAYVAYELGYSYKYRRDFAKATELFEECINISRKLDSSRLESLRYESYGVTALGSLLAEQGKYEQARALLKRGRELKEELGNRYSTAISIASLADLEFRQGNFETALKLQNDALRIYKEIGATSAASLRLRDIGDIYYNQGKYTEAVVAYKESRTLGLNVETSLDLATTLLRLAQTYGELQRYDDALAAYRDRLALLETLAEKDLYRVGITLRGIGEIYHHQRKFEEAQFYYERAREALEQATDVSELATILLRLAEVYASLRNYEASLATYEERLTLLDSLPQRDPHRVGITFNGIAQVYQGLQKPEDAVSYYTLAREQLLEEGSEDALISILLELGREYTELKDYDKSLAMYEEGLEMVESPTDENARLKGVILYRMGDVHKSLGRHDKALEYFEQARELSENVARPIDLVALLDTLAETYEAVGQEDKATEARAVAETILTGLAESEDTDALLTVASYFLDQWKPERVQAALDRADLLLIEQRQAGQSTKTETDSLGRSYLGLGRAHERREEYDKALTNYQKANSLLDSSANPQLYGVVLHDIGDVYRAQEQLEQALTYYQKAREYKAKGSNRRDLARTLQVLADVHVDLGQHEEGLIIYEEAVKELDSSP